MASLDGSLILKAIKLNYGNRNKPCKESSPFVRFSKLQILPLLIGLHIIYRMEIYKI